jgi:16S rRNA processing protein RimM
MASRGNKREAADDLIPFGRIGRAVGIKGQVMLQPYFRESDAPSSFTSVLLLQADGVRREVAVTEIRRTATGWAMQLAGVSSRDAAGALTHTEVLVSKHAIRPAGDGEVYSFQVEGFDAVDASGEPVGKVLGFDNFGGGDLLVIRYRGDSLYLPFAAPHVGDFDFEARTVTVDIEDFLPRPRKSGSPTPDPDEPSDP